MKPMRLSKNFTLDELIESRTADKYGIDNEPTPEAIANLIGLCENVLQPMREQFGVILVTSGYRSPELNDVIGGATDSQHMAGEAADIKIPAVHLMEAALWLQDKSGVDFDQLIAEKLVRGCNGCGWLHVSYVRKRRANRGEVLSWHGKGSGYKNGLQYLR